MENESLFDASSLIDITSSALKDWEKDLIRSRCLRSGNLVYSSCKQCREFTGKHCKWGFDLVNGYPGGIQEADTPK